MSKQLTAYVDEQTRAWLERRARDEERSLSQIAGRVLREAREREERAARRGKPRS